VFNALLGLGKMQGIDVKLLPLTQSKHANAGFTLLEALVASALLAFGLAGAARLSVTTLNATELSRHVDVASGLAQDMTECWGVQTPSCRHMYQTNAPLYPLLSHPELAFVRTWQVRSISVADMPPAHLQELRIAVTWQEDRQAMQIEWQHRRASTPLWVGR
jgi:prepilin-type N-terminal cleavage/methylation domain-containing protein